MIVWIDAQLPPSIAGWLRSTLGVDAYAVRDLGLRDASDRQIFDAACKAGAVVMTKDSDFVHLQETLGHPPQILWLTCGNTSNARLRELISSTWPLARSLLEKGEPLVEIGDR